jgi:serine protease Do
MPRCVALGTIGDFVVSRVFISYRTRDGDWAARLIYEKLSIRFGADQVFYASRSMKPGDDFPQVIQRQLASIDVLLAVIGSQWEDAANEFGERRLDKDDDYVRHEIRTAFTRKVRVIPVLLDGRAELSESDLPEDIVALARRQYLRLHHRGEGGLAELVERLTMLLPSGTGEPWRVRIRDASGGVRGAGVLLGDQHVLTCAHVVIGASADVTIDFIGLGHTPSMRARVVPEWCIRPRDDQRGDVALLQLDQQLAIQVGATLRRTALSWDRAVRVCGFPREAADGEYTRATLTGYGCPGGEWLRMHARWSGDPQVSTGFGGAGVVDDKTGAVLGIVVGKYAGEVANLSWMLPAETILSHIPRVSEWVTGGSAADEAFSKPTDPNVGHRDFERTLTEWLARRDTGDCIMIIVGSKMDVVYRAVALSSREQRTGDTDRSEGTAPALGSIDLAVDASGKTVDEVARRILNRAGVPPDDTVSASEQVRVGVPPMTIVVDGVDNAQQPEALLNEVLKPLAENDSRLVLGFHEKSSSTLATARAWRFGSVDHRLWRLAERINKLEIAERRLISLRRHIYDPGPITYRGATLQVALSALQRIVTGSGSDSIRPELERCERAAVQTLRQAEKVRALLEEKLDERDILRSRLNAYRAKAIDHDLVEDIETAAFYDRARELLWRAPTDLSAAQEAVRDYRLAIRRTRG